MSLYVASLNSGSNGNCYYIGNEAEALLIDAGISCRETERRMKKLNLPIERVKAIFVTHEHSDHITGVAALSKKYRLPVYITPPTFQASRIPIEAGLLKSFEAYQPIRIGELSAIPFPKSHDAMDPHSFLVCFGLLTVGVFTDIGHPCPHVIKNFSKCDVVFLESNYCPEMLANGNYPFALKKRIDSEDGHLSNAQALDLFLKHRSKKLSHLILCHLSKNNNRVELVKQLFEAHAANITTAVASRYRESEVFPIEQTALRAPRKLRAQRASQQLSLF